MARNGPETTDFFRLFMVPGMFHRRGGVGRERLDGLTALINGVETGTELPLSRDAECRRSSGPHAPACPYPQVALYSGNGSVDDAATSPARRRTRPSSFIIFLSTLGGRG